LKIEDHEVRVVVADGVAYVLASSHLDHRLARRNERGAYEITHPLAVGCHEDRAHRVRNLADEV
jgi:hypothetical protein